MSAVEFSEQAVEAAARAIHEVIYGPESWDEDTCDHEARRSEARAALSAALPFLALDRDATAAVIEQAWQDPNPAPTQTFPQWLADTVIAASPLRSVTEVRERVARDIEAAMDGATSQPRAHPYWLGGMEEAARIARGGAA